MLSRVVIIAMLSGLACSATAQDTSADAAKAPRSGLPPVENFFGQAKYQDFRLSPDGKLLSADVPSNGRRNLALIDIGNGTIRMLTSLTNNDLASYRWIGNRLLEVRSGNIKDASGVAGVRQIAIIDSAGDVVRDMRPTGRRSPSRVIATLDRAGDDLIIASNERSDTGLDAYRFNPRTNQKQLLTIETPGEVVQYVADWAGQVRAAVSIIKGGTRQVFSYRRSNADKWTTLRDEPVDAVTLVPAAFDFDNKTLFVYASSSDNGGRAAVRAFDPDADRLGDRIYESPSVDAGPVVFDEVRKVAIGVRDDSAGGITWIDPEWKRLQDSVDAALPKTRNFLAWARDDTSRVIIRTESDRQPPIYFLLDRTSHQLQEIASAYPALDEKDLSPRTFVRYPARDGLSIPGYLTMPRNPDGAKPPLIVNIHGGPFVPASGFGYSAEAQFLASRGYAVLEPDFRGTSGYGNAFAQAGYKQWGLAMQDDVTDGVKWLIDTGKVDPDRVCLFGGSYGGYATLWGLEKEPQMFRCGVAFVAVSDIELLFDVNWSDTNRYDRENRSLNFYVRTIGDPSKDRNKLREVSPLYHADRIRAPLLLAYGAADVRVPLIHGNRMRSALDKLDKPYEWVVYSDEGHGFNRDDNKFDFYRRIDAFLAKNLARRNTTAASSTDGGTSSR